MHQSFPVWDSRRFAVIYAKPGCVPVSLVCFVHADRQGQIDTHGQILRGTADFMLGLCILLWYVVVFQNTATALKKRWLWLIVCFHSCMDSSEQWEPMECVRQNNMWVHKPITQFKLIYERGEEYLRTTRILLRNRFHLSAASCKPGSFHARICEAWLNLMGKLCFYHRFEVQLWF